MASESKNHERVWCADCKTADSYLLVLVWMVMLHPIVKAEDLIPIC